MLHYQRLKLPRESAKELNDNYIFLPSLPFLVGCFYITRDSIIHCSLQWIHISGLGHDILSLYVVTRNSKNYSIWLFTVSTTARTNSLFRFVFVWHFHLLPLNRLYYKWSDISMLENNEDPQCMWNEKSVLKTNYDRCNRLIIWSYRNCWNAKKWLERLLQSFFKRVS